MVQPKTELIEGGASAPEDADISLLALGNVLLRRRRVVAALALLGALWGVGTALLSPRLYVSSATFIPQGSETSGGSGLALAASQIGIRMPVSGSIWGPPIYVALLHSRTLLEPIVLDTLIVAEEGGRRIALMDLLGVSAPDPGRRTDGAIRAIDGLVAASEDKKLGAVRLSVSTPWPSVSLHLARRLVGAVNRFNFETRKSQAAEERRFVEAQAAEAERALRDAEDRLQAFQQRNRVIAGAPELQMALDRLARDLTLRQQVYNSLLQNREEAKIREVRDTPVITMLEDPQLPVVGESRGSVRRVVLGLIGGAMTGVLIAFLAHGIAAGRRDPSDDTREFFRLIDEAIPRFVRRRGQSA